MKDVSHEIVVVNDGSRDRTDEVASRIKGIKLVSYTPNRGKGYALRAGMKASSGEIIVVQDADMATKEILNIIKPIRNNEADFVNGTRMILPMEKGAMKKLHVIGNFGFALVVSMMIRQRLTDTLCGFKAFRRNTIEKNLKENSWPDFEYILEAKKMGLRIKEVPIHYQKRKKGYSKMKSFRHGYNMISMLLRAMFR